jgi:DNA-binding LacI/PurR family transcriptional regulator
LSAAAELDHSVLADISLVGVNNTHLAKIGSIRLTSVDIHLYEQCSLCGDTLVKHIADPGWAHI